MSERTDRDTDYVKRSDADPRADQERRMREQKPAVKASTTSSANDPSYAAPSEPLIEPKVAEPRVPAGFSTYTGAPYSDNPTALPTPPVEGDAEGQAAGRRRRPDSGEGEDLEGRAPRPEQQPSYGQPTLPGMEQRPGQPTQLPAPAPERPRATPA